MPLKIRVKPEGKIFAGGAVLKNVSTHSVDLLVLSDSPVLRDDYLMNIDRKDDSDASNVYFLLQVVYLFKGKGKPLDNLVVDTVRGFGKLYPHLQPLTEEVIDHLTTGDSFKALRVAHKLLSEQQKIGADNPSSTMEKVGVMPSLTTSVSSLAVGGALA